jgi:hypothetical protein
MVSVMKLPHRRCNRTAQLLLLQGLKVLQRNTVLLLVLLDLQSGKDYTDLPGKSTGQFLCPHIPERYCCLLVQKAQKVEAANAQVCQYLHTHIHKFQLSSIPSLTHTYLSPTKRSGISAAFFCAAIAKKKHVTDMVLEEGTEANGYKPSSF